MVEPSQVEAGPEDARAAVAGMIDLPASQHADLDLGVEQDQVDGAFRGGEGGVVLGVEVARVAQLQHARPALAANVDRAQVGHPAGAEVVQPLERLGGRAQHRPDQVGPGARGREHLREEQPLGQLHTLLLGELALQLGGDAGARGR